MNDCPIIKDFNKWWRGYQIRLGYDPDWNSKKGIDGFGPLCPYKHFLLPKIKTLRDFFFNKNKVYDIWGEKLYTLSEFKKILNKEIQNENEYQLSIDREIVKIKQVYPFTLNNFEEALFAIKKSESDQRTKEIKRLFMRVTPVADQDLARAKEVSISDFVKLNGFDKACCPFHKEKTPSFTYYRKQNRWWCFGACGEGGDVLDFIMKRDGVELPKAISICLNTH